MEVRWRTQSDLAGDIAGQDRTDEQQAVLLCFFLVLVRYLVMEDSGD